MVPTGEPVAVHYSSDFVSLDQADFFFSFVWLKTAKTWEDHSYIAVDGIHVSLLR